MGILQNQTWMTTLLLAINVAVFLLETFDQLQINGDFHIGPRVLLDYGASYTPLINAGDYWRLWSPMFVHLNPFHLVFNMATLLFVGPLIEREVGPVRLLCAYLLSGLAGNLLSYVMLPEVASAGASTSLFGLTVYAALLLPRARRLLMVILAANLLVNLVEPTVDIYGHLGGLAGGALLAVLMFDVDELDRVRIPSWLRSSVALTLTTVLFMVTLFYDYLP
ncbi:rhomboid family intramembrane serine protease [Lactiplantibacillus garii]|uniref:Rhomboid family intramembrane serine protease n=1 Tax=Lactiplantibacillus garii TaxID=2306423 RepID=A0A426D510_9LACO|nr:rhomboid family intramembrane serine protease [Lactiplantibacillus garii]RRK09767.1 rhomboid family intramembrane serine protease [Lactiplantibacillus garii]